MAKKTWRRVKTRASWLKKTWRWFKKPLAKKNLAMV
jgi:hypothetical protein